MSRNLSHFHGPWQLWYWTVRGGHRKIRAVIHIFEKSAKFFNWPFVQFSGANNLKSFSHCVFWLLSSNINLSFLRSKNRLPKKFKTPFPISFQSFWSLVASLIGQTNNQSEFRKLSSTNCEPIITKISWIAKSDEHPPSSQPCHLNLSFTLALIGQ